MKTTVSCNLFAYISSLSGGTVLSASSGDISFIQNEFIRITSQSSPGCFFVQDCTKFTLENNYFEYCSGNGDNAAYGNVLNSLRTPYTINYFSAFQCSPSTTQSADSLIHSDFCDSYIKIYNSTYCYGHDGSSSVSIWNTNQPNSIYYLNAIDNINHNTFEIWKNTHLVTVYHSNFINATKNSAAFIHTNCPVKFINCLFEQTGSKSFASDITQLTFEKCFCDISIPGQAFTITSSTYINFDANIDLNCYLNSLQNILDSSQSFFQVLITYISIFLI